LSFLFKLFLYDDGGTKFMWLWEFGAPLEIAARALLLSQGLYEGPTLGESGEWSNVPFAFNYGITGVGLYVRNPNDIVPSIYTVGSPDLKEMTWTPFPSGGPFYEAVARVFGTELDWILKDVIVVQTGRLELQADPGDPIQTTTDTGQLGAPVQWGTSYGYLTAGHVGKSVGSIIQDSALNTVGTVVFAMDPTGKGATPEIDVAVVEVAGKVWSNRLSITGAAVARGSAAVDVYRRSYPNPIPSTIQGGKSWFVASPPGAPLTTLNAVYLTSAGVTAGGDSGGPVMLSGTTTMIGHVAAGGPATSCIQDVRHQMRKIKSNPAFRTIRF
jgi:hypothetical protein